MSEDLVTIQESFLVVLDSGNADILNNSTKKSSVTFYFEEPIRKKEEALQMTCSVLQFTAPNSLYNINETNNQFHISEKINNILVPYYINIPYGNYNVNTFMKQFLTSMSSYSSNFDISVNYLTNKLTISNTAGNYFVIKSTSTIANVMGFIEGAELGALVNQYSCDYPVNFNGINSINILMENLNTNNIDSFNKSNSSIIQSVPYDPSYPVINFIKTQTYNFNIRNQIIDHITIGLKDNSENYLNFNNKDWSLTLLFNVLKDIDRFEHQHTFFNIING